MNRTLNGLGGNDTTTNVYVNTAFASGEATEVEQQSNLTQAKVNLAFKSNTTQATSVNNNDLILIADNATGKIVKYVEANLVGQTLTATLPLVISNDVISTNFTTSSTDTLTNKTITEFTGGSSSTITTPSTTGTLALTSDIPNLTATSPITYETATGTIATTFTPTSTTSMSGKTFTDSVNFTNGEIIIKSTTATSTSNALINFKNSANANIGSVGNFLGDFYVSSVISGKDLRLSANGGKVKFNNTDTEFKASGTNDFNSGIITNLSTINTHTIPSGTGTFALTSQIIDPINSINFGTNTSTTGTRTLGLSTQDTNINGDTITIQGQTATNLRSTNSVNINGTAIVLTPESSAGVMFNSATNGTYHGIDVKNNAIKNGLSSTAKVKFNSDLDVISKNIHIRTDVDTANLKNAKIFFNSTDGSLEYAKMGLFNDDFTILQSIAGKDLILSNQPSSGTAGSIRVDGDMKCEKILFFRDAQNGVDKSQIFMSGDNLKIQTINAGNTDIEIIPTGAGKIKLLGDTQYNSLGTNDFNSSSITNLGSIEGGLNLKNGNTSAGFIDFFETSSTGTNKITLKPHTNSIASDYTITLPDSGGQMILDNTTDTFSNKSFSDVINFVISSTNTGSVGLNGSNIRLQALTGNSDVQLVASGAGKISFTGNTEFFSASTINANSSNITNVANINSHPLPSGSSELVDLNSTQTLTNKSISYSQLTGTPTIPTNNNQLTNGALYITANSTDTLTNKNFGDNVDITGQLKITRVGQALILKGVGTGDGNVVGMDIQDTTNTRKGFIGNFDSSTSDMWLYADAGNIRLRGTDKVRVLSNKLAIGSQSGTTDPKQAILQSPSSITADYTLDLPSSAGTLALTSQIPTNNNQLTNGANYITASSTDNLTNKTFTDTPTFSNGEIVLKSTTATSTSNAFINFKNSSGTAIGFVGNSAGDFKVSGGISGKNLVLETNPFGNGNIKLDDNTQFKASGTNDFNSGAITNLSTINTHTIPTGTSSLITANSVNNLENKNFTDTPEFKNGEIKIKATTDNVNFLDCRVMFHSQDDTQIGDVGHSSGHLEIKNLVSNKNVEIDTTGTGEIKLEALTECERALKVSNANFSAGYIELFENSTNGSSAIKLSAPEAIATPLTETKQTLQDFNGTIALVEKNGFNPITSPTPGLEAPESGFYRFSSGAGANGDCMIMLEANNDNAVGNQTSMLIFRKRNVNRATIGVGTPNISYLDDFQINSMGKVVITQGAVNVMAYFSSTEVFINKILKAKESIETSNGSTSAGFVDFFENTNNGTDKIRIIAPETITGISKVLTLPNETGTIATIGGNAFTMSGSFTSKLATAPQSNDYIFSSGNGGNGSCRVIIKSDTDNQSDETNNCQVLFSKEGDAVQGSIGMGIPNSNVDQNDMNINSDYAGSSIYLKTQGTTRVEIKPDEVIVPKTIPFTAGGGIGSSGAEPIHIGNYLSGYNNSSGQSIFNVIYSQSQYIYFNVSAYDGGSVNGGSYAGYIDYQGFQDISDRRLKEDIIYLDSSSCLQQALDLKPCSFKFKQQTKKPRGVGFIAQEVEQVVPEVVSQDGTGGLGLGYGHLTATLSGAVQELNKIIQQQNERIQNLENIINKLTASSSFANFKKII